MFGPITDGGTNDPLKHVKKLNFGILEETTLKLRESLILFYLFIVKVLIRFSDPFKRPLE